MADTDGLSDVIWMRPQPARRTVQPPLSRDQITAAALAVADAEGVGAVTMRRIAQHLGCGTMSLYRHVRNKDELLELMVDAAVGEEEPRTGSPGGWQEDLRALARAKRAVMLRHPWLAPLMAGRPVLGPHVVESIERSLSAVDGLGLSVDEMVRCFNTLNAFVNGFVQTELEERKWRRPVSGDDSDAARDTWQHRTGPYLEHLVDSGRYPLFSRMVNEAESYPDPDEAFEWQLQRVLDGLATALPE
ncbi:TetR/AcrR family transcriptional regulator [Streptomyces pimonensis]|uniref:TetR/AcrR family transcriptional regulator n=1 Tax=Streptomyces pimonensis TaxID=2860288 RepID=A0ABV4J6H2_9ACTN